MIFQTSRLLIRPLTNEDFEPFHEMQSNFKVMQYTSGKAQTLEENKSDLEKVINHYHEVNNGFWVWAMERKSDQELIGTVAMIVDKKNEGEVGCRLLEKYWGNGYAAETLKDLIDYGLEKMKLKAIHANADVRNIASIKILDKSILEFIGEEWNEDFQSNDRLYRLEQ